MFQCFISTWNHGFSNCNLDWLCFYNGGVFLSVKPFWSDRVRHYRQFFYISAIRSAF